MSEPIWNEFLTERDKAVFAASGYNTGGGLAKITDALNTPDHMAQVLALRLSVLFHHARRAIEPPRITLV